MYFGGKFCNKRNILFFVLFIYLAGFNFIVCGAGELDSTFAGSVAGNSGGIINVVKIQPDGKILAGGYFNDADGVAASAITRLNPDGSVDVSFRAPDFFGPLIGQQVYAVALQADGKILVGGSFQGAGSEFKPGVRRLNTDGTLDASFPVTELQNSSTVYEIEVQPDGKILVGGTFRLFRLNSDGTPDNSFSSSVDSTTNSPLKDIELQADGKILIGGGAVTGFLRRLNSDGSADSSFSSLSVSGSVEAVKIRPDGKILIGGGFNAGSSNRYKKLALIDANGVLDTTFSATTLDGLVNDVFLKPDGKIIIGGSFTAFNGNSRNGLAQVNAGGSLDTSVQFSTPAGLGAVLGSAVQPDGKVVAGFQAGSLPLTRFNTDGSVDSSFSRPFFSRYPTSVVHKIQPLPDGKILAAGKFVFASGATGNSLARFNTNGTVDTSFVPYFNAIPNPTINAFAVQPDGKIVVGIGGTGLRRLNADGSQDTTFINSGGDYTEIVYLPNGKFLLADTCGSVCGNIRRLNSNGTSDNSFSPQTTTGFIRKIFVLSDGKVLIAGEFTQVGNQSVSSKIARLNADGSLDASFTPASTNGGIFDAIYDIDVQTDGRIVIGGGFTSLNGNSNHSRIGRLNADGTLDTSFVQGTNGTISAVKIQPDGKILIGGAMSAVQGAPHNGIARLNPDGALDTSFNTFANMAVQDINLQTDGKILIGGDFTKINQLSAVRIARLLNTTAQPRTLFDYDGDGKADISVFRPSENKWFILRSSDSQITQPIFAIAGDVPVPADYDGDGKADVAIFRPSSGDWWYQSSIDNAQINVHWGQSGDVPRPSDFDGDGKTDFVVYRPSNSAWYRLGSTGVTSVIAFGIAEDKPLVGDFDGDGKTEPAVFRPSSGDWWYASSQSGQFITVHWGASGDIPVPGDYDGDSKTDFVVFRPTDGGWYILYSTGSYTIATFGTVGDKPVAADYDGDGKADIGVFRPSTGTWYLLETTAGFGAVQFGTATDIPMENAFLP
ncbi:MAG TPA: FG-GAP-like repeat-containing protein [Pyrinomonadaceae bacterium]|jgi:uncharacterized delta-60 repeat protein